MQMTTPIEKAVQILGGTTACAICLGVESQAVSQWKSGKTKPSPENASAIEKATNGEVKAIDLRPDLAKIFQS